MARAQSFGGEWWTDRWINALDAFGWQHRLERGRSYARTGRVVSLTIEPGVAEARVRGSRPVPYRVVIKLEAFSRAIWDEALNSIAEKARYAGQLLAGEMPRDIDDLFGETGHSLFPQRSVELRHTCTCPDVANPCKHIAAVHYILGAQFDADPFVLFRLRGMPREIFLAELRARRHVAAAHEEPTAPTQPAEPPRPVTLEGFHGEAGAIPQQRLEIELPGIDAEAFALSLPRALTSDQKLLDILAQTARRAAAAVREQV